MRDSMYKGRNGWIFATFCTFALMLGCGGVDHSVVGSDTDVALEAKADAPAGYLVFVQPNAGQAATKKVKVDVSPGDFTHRATDGFKFDKGGKLEIEFKEEKGRKDDDDGDDGDDGDQKDREVRVKKATFSVKKKSIDISNLTDEEVEKYVHRNEIDITMAVSSGTALEDVVVGFGPSGLLFDPEAKLELQLTGKFKDLLPEGKSYAYHIDEDGHVTKVEMDIDFERSGCKLRIKVPGFSRYTIDD